MAQSLNGSDMDVSGQHVRGWPAGSIWVGWVVGVGGRDGGVLL